MVAVRVIGGLEAATQIDVGPTVEGGPTFLGSVGRLSGVSAANGGSRVLPWPSLSPIDGPPTTTQNSTCPQFSWTITSGMEAMSSHIVVEDLRESRRLLDRLNELVRERFGVQHTTSQLEDH